MQIPFIFIYADPRALQTLVLKERESLPCNLKQFHKLHVIMVWYHHSYSSSRWIYSHNIHIKICVFKHHFNKPNHKNPGSSFECLCRLLLSSKHADIHDHLHEAGHWNSFSRSNDATFHSSQVSPYLFTLTRKKSTNNWWFQTVVTTRYDFKFPFIIKNCVSFWINAHERKGLARLFLQIEIWTQIMVHCINNST